jgi:hypothetical protein
MPSQPELVALNVETARGLRAEGLSYRDIGRRLGLTSSQLGLIRRTLKREKSGRTRLLSQQPGASDRDLLVSRSVLPAGLRKRLSASGYRTLGDLADRLSDPELPGLEALPGIGPYRARLVKGLLDHYALLAGSSDLQAEIEALFPELRAPPSATEA